MTGAKICGVTTAEAVAAAVDGGAGFLGFNFFPKSPRFLTPEAAAPLAARVRGRAKVVAVTVDPTDGELDAISALLQPDLIQLHGRESAERAAEVRARTGAGVIKVLSVGRPEDLAPAGDFAVAADYLMFDAKPPAGSALPGGVGARFDWSLLAGARFARPWFLAGGLDPGNVAQAVRLSGAPLVDVSSGVESAPGRKDPVLITAFLEALAQHGRSPSRGSCQPAGLPEGGAV